MKNKKMLIIGACIALCGISVWGSYAWLSAHADAITNTFTSTDKSNISIALEEKKFEKEKAGSYLPGDMIKKDPTIKNTSEKESVYAAIKVTYQVVKDNKTTDISKEEFKEYAIITDVNNAWKLIYEDPTGYEVYMYQKEVKAQTSIQPELFQTVLVNKGIAFDEQGNLPAFNIKVEGYATQYRNITLEEAVKTLITLVKTTGE